MFSQFFGRVTIQPIRISFLVGRMHTFQWLKKKGGTSIHDSQCTSLDPQHQHCLQLGTGLSMPACLQRCTCACKHTLHSHNLLAVQKYDLLAIRMAIQKHTTYWQFENTRYWQFGWQFGNTGIRERDNSSGAAGGLAGSCASQPRGAQHPTRGGYWRPNYCTAGGRGTEALIHSCGHSH